MEYLALADMRSMFWVQNEINTENFSSPAEKKDRKIKADEELHWAGRTVFSDFVIDRKENKSIEVN